MHVKFWLEKLKGKDHLGHNKCRWDENIKMDLRHRVWRCGVDSIGLEYSRMLVNVVMTLQVLSSILTPASDIGNMYQSPW